MSASLKYAHRLAGFEAPTGSSSNMHNNTMIIVGVHGIIVVIVVVVAY